MFHNNVQIEKRSINVFLIQIYNTQNIYVVYK